MRHGGVPKSCPRLGTLPAATRGVKRNWTTEELDDRRAVCPHASGVSGHTAAVLAGRRGGRRDGPRADGGDVVDLIDFSENLPHTAVEIQVVGAEMLAADFDPPHHHVVEDPRRIETGAARHGGSLAQSHKCRNVAVHPGAPRPSTGIRGVPLFGPLCQQNVAGTVSSSALFGLLKYLRLCLQ